MEEIPYHKLPLGFRFRPTDEQLINHYLKRKTNGTIQPLESLLIPEIDVCRTEPWELPSKWRVKSSDLEWFFFAAVARKYPSGNRSNRATKNGYWKTTGKDRLIKSKNVLVGMKKTLVFHIGRAPRGTGSCWIMHEYRVVNPDGTDVVGDEGAFVLNRLFKKDKDILNITPLSQASPNSDLSGEPRISSENIYAQLTEYNVADDEVLPYLVSSTMEPELSHSNSGITTDVGSHQELRIKQEGTFVLCRLFKKDKDILNITPLSQASPNSDLSDEPQINPENTSGQITEYNVANDEVLPYLIPTTMKPLSQASPNSDLSDEPQINPENTSGQITEYNVANDEVLPYLIPTTMKPKQSHSNRDITTDVCTHQELRIIQEIKADMDKEGSSSRNPNPAAEQHQSPNFFMDAGATNVIRTVNGQIIFQQTFK